jgi:hypothetical protein
MIILFPLNLENLQWTLNFIQILKKKKTTLLLIIRNNTKDVYER